MCQAPVTAATGGGPGLRTAVVATAAAAGRCGARPGPYTAGLSLASTEPAAAAEPTGAGTPAGPATAAPRRRAWARVGRRPPPPPVLVPHEVTIDGLDPAHDGVTIAHLSDLHVGSLTPAEHVRAAVELATGAGAEVIALTGDYVCWRKHEVGMLREQVAGLAARRVVATLGNHDYFTSAAGVVRALAGHGVDVLRNRHTTLAVRGRPLHLIGVDDPVTRHHDLDQAFAGVPASGTRVVLCHCPEQAPGLAARGADLVLSGHTHGGQIFVPGLTDRIIDRMGKRYRRGFYAVAPDAAGGGAGRRAQLYVTPGVGFSGVRVRAGDGTRAEVALFTLRAGVPRAG